MQYQNQIVGQSFAGLSWCRKLKNIVAGLAVGLGAALSLTVTPGAFAQGAESCGAAMDPVILTEGPYVVGQTVRVRLRMSAQTIQGGNFLEIPLIRFRLDCDGGGSCAGLFCDDEGPVISYNGDGSISTNCGVAVASNSPGGGTLPNEVVFTFTPPVQLEEGQSCDLEFDITIETLDSDASPMIIEQLSFFDGQCFADGMPPIPTITGSACGQKAIPIDLPQINIEKLANPNKVCIGVPTLVNYGYTVTNPGVISLANVMVTDDLCGPVVFLVGDVGDDGILAPGETWLYSCSSTITAPSLAPIVNTATATGAAIVPVSLTNPDPGIVVIEDNIAMDTAMATVSVNPNPTCMISGPTLVCPGATGLTYSVTSDIPGSTFQWSITGDGQINGSMTGSSVAVKADQVCDGRIDLTVTVTSPAGCVGECTFNVDVDDNTPPTIMCPPNQTIPCTQEPMFGLPTASDNCDPNPEIVIVSTITTPGTCPQQFTVTRRWRAVDDCGNQSAICAQTITVVDNVAPTITCPPNQTIECPATPQFGTPTASDLCDPNPMIQQVGEDVITPGECPQEFSVTRTWRAVDACGNQSAPCSQTITVTDNTPPTITCAPNQTIECPATPQFTPPMASDLCDPNPMIQVVGNDVMTPGDCPQEFSVTRTWVAVDACGNQSAPCSQTITVTDNTPPTITCPQDQTIDCTEEPMFGTPTASDLCDPNPMIQQVGEDVMVPGKCPIIATVTRTWIAVDACGNESAPCSQTITLVDETPPTITCPPDQTIECPAEPQFGTPTASDLCDPNPMIEQVGDDVITPGMCPQEFSVTRTWIAVDACGNQSDPCSQTITVTDNTPPTITCAPNESIECPATPQFTPPTATDLCDPNPQIQIVSTTTTPGTCPQEFSTTRTWIAVDACGNQSDPCSQTITVTDNTPPTINCPPNQTIECPATPQFGTPTASDICDPNPMIQIVSTTTAPGPCPQEFSTTRTWRAVDACGNQSPPCSQTITVVDNTPPTIMVPSDQEIECEVPYTFQVDANDLCDPNPSITCTFETVPPGIEPPCFTVVELGGGSFTITIISDCTVLITCVATDACGNATDPGDGMFMVNAVCEDLCSLTQGAWGSAGGAGNLALIQQLLAPGPLVIGKPGRSFSIPQSAAQCIIDRLPAGGPDQVLPAIGDDIMSHPSCQTTPPLPVQNGRFRNNMLGQVISLSLNVRLSPGLGGSQLSAVPGISSSVFSALTSLGLPHTVNGLLELANRALAAHPTGGASLNQIKDAADRINNFYGEGDCDVHGVSAGPQIVLGGGEAPLRGTEGSDAQVADPLDGAVEPGISPEDFAIAQDGGVPQADPSILYISDVIGPPVDSMTLDVEGTIYMLPQATMQVVIAGYEPQVSYSDILITEHAVLNGTLHVNLPGTIQPQAGDRWEIFWSGWAFDGEFHTLDVPELPGGLYWELIQGPSYLALEVKLGGDLNLDAAVNGLDLGIMLNDWSVPATARGCNGAMPCASDLNKDGKVDGLDLGILLANWQAAPIAPAP